VLRKLCRPVQNLVHQGFADWLLAMWLMY
jgi:hypothetical protein